MLFGDPADFAIEAEPDTKPTSSIVWGHMRVWCCGKAFGNFHETDCGISDPQVHMSRLANHLDALASPFLSALDDQAVWDFLDRALYLDVGQSAEDIELDAEAWGRHDFLTNAGEALDGYKSFIFLRDPETLRVLFRRSDEALVGCTVTSTGYVAAVKQFERWCTEIIGKAS
jgi:hypothetical protein